MYIAVESVQRFLLSLNASRTDLRCVGVCAGRSGWIQGHMKVFVSSRRGGRLNHRFVVVLRCENLLACCSTRPRSASIVHCAARQSKQAICSSISAWPRSLALQAMIHGIDASVPKVAPINTPITAQTASATSAADDEFTKFGGNILVPRRQGALGSDDV